MSSTMTRIRINEDEDASNILVQPALYLSLFFILTGLQVQQMSKGVNKAAYIMLLLMYYYAS